MHLEAHRGFREDDPSIGKDVAVVGELHHAVVGDRGPAAVGFGRQQADFPSRCDLVEPHAADADGHVALLVEDHAHRRAADMGKHLVAGVVGREPAQDVAVP